MDKQETYPISFPSPFLSVGFGQNRFPTREKKTLEKLGKVATKTIRVIPSWTAAIKDKTSSSAGRFPNGFPNAISDITSRVKYWNLGARSTGL